MVPHSNASARTSSSQSALARFKTGNEVIRRADEVEVGLASYVMTSDLARHHQGSERLDFGIAAVNTGVITDGAAP